ncbi:hypothetical protein ECDEC12E_5421 [Escherichia coli DEC12E]|nr:hypothetical protein ECDEC12E_5421 [Escherichia coli DEC12E]EHX45942.1 hypothetical protein ECDEC12D_2311 [Escherichia coli DEC12D]
MDSDQERPVIRSTMPVLFLSTLPYQFSLYGLILLCNVLNDAHTTSLYNSITGSIIFPIAQIKISGDIGIINTINRMRNRNSIALLFRG